MQTETWSNFKNLNSPVEKMHCPECGQTVKPGFQIRLRADECGQKTDIICWSCSNCGRDNYMPDDLSVLDAETISA
jgi:RNase P subunit RPR2